MPKYVKSTDGAFNLLNAVVKQSKRDLMTDGYVTLRDRREAAEFLGYLQSGESTTSWGRQSQKSTQKLRGGSRR